MRNQHFVYHKAKVERHPRQWNPFLNLHTLYDSTLPAIVRRMFVSWKSCTKCICGDWTRAQRVTVGFAENHPSHVFYLCNFVGNMYYFFWIVKINRPLFSTLKLRAHLFFYQIPWISNNSVINSDTQHVQNSTKKYFQLKKEKYESSNWFHLHANQITIWISLIFDFVNFKSNRNDRCTEHRVILEFGTRTNQCRSRQSLNVARTRLIVRVDGNCSKSTLIEFDVRF